MVAPLPDGRADGAVVVLVGRRLLSAAQRDDELVDEDGEDAVERVHTAALQPLGDGEARMLKAKLLQDVVHSHRVNPLASPRQQPANDRAQ